MDSVDIRVNWDLRDASASKKLDLKRYSYIESKQIWISMIKKDTQLFGSLGSQKIVGYQISKISSRITKMTLSTYLLQKS